MIPKIIHYCWFGPKSKSKVALKCIESWKQFAPDFEIKEWNESNTKQFQNKFYRDAYRKKKFAFVADIIRVAVLKKHGGIYMDLDILLLKPINTLLEHQFFCSNEIKDRANYAFFGGVPEHRFFNKMYQFYSETHFNEFSLPVITHTFSGIINEKTLQDNEVIFDPEYFYALPYQKRDKDYKEFLTPKSYAVHLWDHSWNFKIEKETFGYLLKNLRTVFVDYLFYNYPASYFKRYTKGFGRKLIRKLLGKS